MRNKLLVFFFLIRKRPNPKLLHFSLKGCRLPRWNNKHVPADDKHRARPVQGPLRLSRKHDRSGHTKPAHRSQSANQMQGHGEEGVGVQQQAGRAVAGQSGHLRNRGQRPEGHELQGQEEH